MKIDVRKLKVSGKEVGEYEFLYEPTENLLEYEGAVIQLPIKVNASVELHADNVYVDGVVECAIVGKCVRCLEQARFDYKETFSVTFVRNNPEEDDYLYNSGVVDLTPAINDLLLTTLPTQLYCTPDCKGLCLNCGGNLNFNQCKCNK